MKKTLLVLFVILPAVLSAQLNNDYPQAGPVRIADYSPNLILQRNTSEGGFVQGIQTKLFDGTNNWFFGNLHQDNWIVSKGDYQDVKFSIQSNGNIGIGTTNTPYKLEVNGSFKSGQGSFVNNAHSAGTNDYNLELYSNNTGDPNKYVSLRFHQSSQFWGQIRYNRYGFRLTQGVDDNLNILTLADLYAMDKIGIGTTSFINNEKLNVNGTLRVGTFQEWGGGDVISALQPGNTQTALCLWQAGIGKALLGFKPNDPNLYLTNDYHNGGLGTAQKSLTITPDGNFGVGTQTPGSYKLNVSGKIRADEIVVNTSGADFVFAPEYSLPDLAEVENFIKENKRLPDVASASEMQTDGMNVSEMQTKMLQKIEELTLYIIELNKKIEILEAEKNN